MKRASEVAARGLKGERPVVGPAGAPPAPDGHTFAAGQDPALAAVLLFHVKEGISSH